MIPLGTTPEQLEEAAARMRAQAVQDAPEEPAQPRVRLRLYSAPIEDAEALGESVDDVLGEIHGAGEQCGKPGIWTDDGHVLVAVISTARGE
jgi:hypothetical protein